MKKRKDTSPTDVSRREFIEGAGAALVVAAASSSLEAHSPGGSPPAPITADPAVPRTTIRVTVNGVAARIEVEDRWTLVELLRDRLQLTGTKIGCDRGECGACTVLMDGKPVYSCSNLAVWADGKTITTVEGLAANGRLSPLQQAFIEHDAAQCGFCTSGQLMAATALLAANPHPAASDVKAAMVGNICRCGNYNRYVESVLAAAGPSARATGAGGPR